MKNRNPTLKMESKLDRWTQLHSCVDRVVRQIKKLFYVEIERQMMDISKILPPHEKSDMEIVKIMPLLLKTRDIETATILCEQLPFWYSEKTSEYSQVFWTENHYFMYIVAEFLLRSMLNLPINPTLLYRLHSILDLKIRHRLSEFLSPVYYPFTISSLLLLFDYSNNSELTEKANHILHIIAHQLLHFTLRDGSMISPSGRSYQRHRNFSNGGHIHLFTNFLLQKPIPSTDQALSYALSSTSWKFHDSIDDILKDHEVHLQLTPSTVELLEYLSMINDDDLFVSILWSYGLYIPPKQYRKKVLSFMDRNNLWRHPHFKSLSRVRQLLCCCPLFWINFITDSYFVSPYVKGLWLTNSGIQIFREGDIIMTSLDHYNEGLPCFQQWPWMVNLSGIVLWCSFGNVSSSSILGNLEATTEASSSDILPMMRQISNQLFVEYKSPNKFIHWTMKNEYPVMRWPDDKFDESLSSSSGWTIGRKNNSVIGFRIHKKKVHIVVMDLVIRNMTIHSFQSHLESLSSP